MTATADIKVAEVQDTLAISQCGAAVLRRGVTGGEWRPAAGFWV